MTNGAVTIVVPEGWTAPQLAAGAGQVTTSTGSISVASQTITVSSLSLNAGQTVTISYLAGVATTTAGAANWTTQQKSTAAGTLTNIASQPSVTVNNAADGSATNTDHLTTLAGTATTETFTFTAPTGGITNGADTIDVPPAGPHHNSPPAPDRSQRASARSGRESDDHDFRPPQRRGDVTITYPGGIATTTAGSRTGRGSRSPP